MIRFKFVVLLLLFITQSMKGQELKVLDVIEDDIDSTATTKPVYDINDNLCAFLIVLVNVKGEITFKGNVLGKPVKSDDMYTMYIADGTKRIKFMHEDFLSGEINFRMFGISIKGGKTYLVKMKEDNKFQVTSDSTNWTLQYLTIKANVPLKKIKVDNEEWTISDGKAKKLIKAGKHKYVVESADGMKKTGYVEVKNTGFNTSLNLEFTK